MVTVMHCKQHKGTFCGQYGTAFYDLKAPEEKVQRATQQGLEGMCAEAALKTFTRLPSNAGSNAPVYRPKPPTGKNIELDEPHSFAVDMMPPCAC
jgi:hypothetical protein